MLTLNRTNSENRDFVSLVALLDADLAVKDGADHSFYSQFNNIDKIKYVVVAYDDATPVACGAIREFEPGIVEVKRMFVSPERRGQGIGRSILYELEQWASGLGFKKCILETGRRQPDAIALYTKCGYRQIANYGQYAVMENSICFEKDIDITVSR